MKKYQYILLDWDGNLAKTLDVWLVAFRTALNKYGYFPTDDEIASNFGRGKEYFQSFNKPKEIFTEADRVGKSMLPDVELYPDALEVLNYFKTVGKNTALITTSFRVYIDHLLDRYEMKSLFDVVICGEDTKQHKPSPEPLLKALSMLGGEADRAIMIGDSYTDLGAAANAGVDCILFYPPEHKKFYDLEKLKQHNPTYIVDDFRQIMTILV